LGELIRWPWSRPPARNEVRELMRRFLEESDDQDDFEWDALTTRDGLPHNWIYDLFHDSTGRVWVGTWGGGLGVFDGRWRTYRRRDGLASDNVTCIREDRLGRVWVATDGGMNRFDSGRFVDAGLTGKSVLNIAIDRHQNLWAGCWRAARSGGGLYRADGVGDQADLGRACPEWVGLSGPGGAPGLEILKVFEDSRGRVWVGTYDGGRGAGVGCWDGRRWRRFTEGDGLVGDCVYSMFEDPEGRMWFGTTKGVAVYDGSVWRTLTKKDGLVDNQVFAMFIDTDKKMWFGTAGGVSRYDGEKWRSFTRKDGLVENLVRAIGQDRDGSLWFGTYPYMPLRGGISRARRPVARDSIETQVNKYLTRGHRDRLLGRGTDDD